MRITQLLFLTIVITFFNLFSMDSNFNKIPKDLLPAILIQQHSEYPWHNFIYIYKLKLICTLWCEIIGDANKLAQTLNIPPMHCAAMMNNPEKIIELKLAGHSPLAPDKYKFIPMDYAFECRQPNALTMLRIGRAIIPYITCARQGYEKIIEIIQAPRTNQYTENDFTKAIADNDYEKVITILSDNVNFCTLEMCDKAKSLGFKNLANLLLYTSQRILECILFSEIKDEKNVSEQFFKNFIKYNANSNTYNENGFTFLHRIVCKKSLQPTLQKLLQLKNIDINLPHLLEGYRAIQFCANTGNIDHLKLLLETKKLKNEPFFDADHDALSYAAYNDHFDCLNLLIQHGGNINKLDSKYGLSPLHYAAINNRLNCLIKILNTPTCIIDIHDSEGYTPLMKATCGHAELMSILIACGANTNLTTPKYKDTLMHIATTNGAEECLKRLLFLPQCKQQINTHNLCDKYTPLIDATRHKHLSCVELLINAKATINAVDIWGQTALHFAAAKGFDTAIPLLITHGACVNYVSKPDYIYNTHDGHYTPIHFAAQNGHSNAIKLLIQYGADTSLKTQLGKTALDLAYENNHLETAKLFLLPQ